MRKNSHRGLSRPDVLNFVYKERPKFLATAWSLLGDCHSAEQVFRELVTALEDQPAFADGETLERWCWKSARNRCENLKARGTYRRHDLPEPLLGKLDTELRSRDHDELADYADALRPCVCLLAHDARWVVQAFFGDGKRGLDAARLLNLNPGSFYSALQRVYTGLSKCQQKRVAMGRIPRVDAIPRNAEFERRAFRYLDDELSAEGVGDFARELAEHRDRIPQFNDLRLSCALLRDYDSSPAKSPQPLKSSDRDAKSAARRRHNRNLAFSYLASTVIVGAMIGVFSLIRIDDKAAAPTPEEAHVPAKFVRGAKARFFGRESLKFGDPLAKGSYTLSAGNARIQFAKGAELDIEGPAEFTISSADRVKLHRGRVSAVVPRPAIGFTIDTEFVSIRDLGTAFGVISQPGLATDVVVFEGRVEVSSEMGQGTRLLEKGQGLQYSKHGEHKLSASQEAHRFPRLLPSSEPKASPDNLLVNPSFESGPLSRAPHSGHRYRDLATDWLPGRFVNMSWSKNCPDTAAGTLVYPSTAAPVPSPPNGERYLYLSRASARQRVGPLKAGARYRLDLKVARPPTEISPATIKVALMADSSAVDTGTATVLPGSEFAELNFELTLPRDEEIKEAPHFLMLTAAGGTVFFDGLRLVPAPTD